MICDLELNFGKSFTGKTSRMLHELRDERRVVFVDPKLSPEMTNLRNWEHQFPVYDAERNRWMGKDTLAYFERVQRCSFRAMVHFRSYHTEQLELLCILLMGMKNIALAVDELAYFLPAGNADRIPPQTKAAVFSGRHDALKFTGTAQHPSLVNMLVKTNAQKIRWFRMDEKNSLDAARRQMSKDFVDSLPSLPDYVCIETSDRKPPFRDESLKGKIRILTGKRSSDA